MTLINLKSRSLASWETGCPLGSIKSRSVICLMVASVNIGNTEPAVVPREQSKSYARHARAGVRHVVTGKQQETEHKTFVNMHLLLTVSARHNLLCNAH